MSIHPNCVGLDAAPIYFQYPKTGPFGQALCPPPPEYGLDK